MLSSPFRENRSDTWQWPKSCNKQAVDVFEKDFRRFSVFRGIVQSRPKNFSFQNCSTCPSKSMPKKLPTRDKLKLQFLISRLACSTVINLSALDFLSVPRVQVTKEIMNNPNCNETICDGMTNCHLTEPWAGYMNQRTHMALTQYSSDIPILTPYVTSMELPRHHSSFLCNQSVLHQVYTSEMNNVVTCQQQTFQEEFSPIADFGSSTSRYEFENTARTTLDYVSENDERIKASIKFQDRNKKLDFKVNFRDENLKVNGCFYREDSKSPTNALAPPKKKWIRHYLTGKEK